MYSPHLITGHSRTGQGFCPVREFTFVRSEPLVRSERNSTPNLKTHVLLHRHVLENHYAGISNRGHSDRCGKSANRSCPVRGFLSGPKSSLVRSEPELLPLGLFSSLVVMPPKKKLTVGGKELARGVAARGPSARKAQKARGKQVTSPSTKQKTATAKKPANSVSPKPKASTAGQKRSREDTDDDEEDEEWESDSDEEAEEAAEEEAEEEVDEEQTSNVDLGDEVPANELPAGDTRAAFEQALKELAQHRGLGVACSNLGVAALSPLVIGLSKILSKVQKSDTEDPNLSAMLDLRSQEAEGAADIHVLKNMMEKVSSVFFKSASAICKGKRVARGGQQLTDELDSLLHFAETLRDALGKPIPRKSKSRGVKVIVVAQCLEVLLSVRRDGIQSRSQDQVPILFMHSLVTSHLGHMRVNWKAARRVRRGSAEGSGRWKVCV